MDAPVGGKIGWLVLIYQLPREPPWHRVAVWRRLKALGAGFSHRGDACSFEAMLQEYDLMGASVLREISEIRGMQLALPDVEALTLHTDVIFYGLYAYLRREML